METKLDVSLMFPLDFTIKSYEKLVKFCGSVEDVESNFQIEFSCGDGKYFSDFWKRPFWKRPVTSETDEEIAKYDGMVCLQTPPRLNSIKMSMLPEQMKFHTIYRFTVKYSPKNEEVIFYINGKERSRQGIEE